MTTATMTDPITVFILSVNPSLQSFYQKKLHSGISLKTLKAAEQLRSKLHIQSRMERALAQKAYWSTLLENPDNPWISVRLGKEYRRKAFEEPKNSLRFFNSKSALKTARYRLSIIEVAFEAFTIGLR